MTFPHPIASVLLALALPQAPALAAQANANATPSTPAPNEAIAHAQAFPDSTLACVTLRATKTQLDALSKQAVIAVLLDNMAQRGLSAVALDARLQEATGQTLAQWLAVLHGGLTVGITELQENGQPRWVLVADVQDQATVFSAMLDRARQAPGAGAAEGGADLRTWLVSTPLGRTAFAVADNRLLAGDCAASVQEAVARLRATNPRGTLAATPGLADFEAATATQPQRVFAAFARPNLLCERALLTVPATTANKARGVLRALDITRIGTGGVSIALDGDQLVETYHFDWPAPRNGPLAELMAPKAALRSEVAALIPADATAFSASALDLQRVFHSCKRLFTELAPQQSDQVQAMIAQWNERMGINVEDDLLAKLAPQMVTLQWMQGNDTETAVVLQLSDASHFDRAMRRALAAFPDTVQEQNLNGYRTYLFDRDGNGPAVTLAEDNLVLGTTQHALRRALDQIAAPRGAQPAVVFPPGVSAYSVTPLANLLARGELVLAQGGPGLLAFGDDVAATLRGVRQALGSAVLQTSSTRDERNVSLRMRSPVGGVFTLSTLSGATFGMPKMFAHTQAQVGRARTQSALPAALLRIVAAQREFQNKSNGTPAHTLRDLITAGLLTETDLGTAIDDVVFERDGYKLTLLLNESDAGTFIAVAWPAREQTGPVFAASPGYPALINEVMAGAKGLATVELADIYNKGFGSPMRSGWRVATAVADAAPTNATRATGKLATAVAALESGTGDRDAAIAVLRQALASDNIARVAYATHTMGRLKVSEEVPNLVALVAKHQDVGVRTQAMWALLQLGDPRSKQTSIEALGSESAELRALAAANLGKLHATEATPALLGLLPKGPSPNDPTNDERDRAMALLALTDLGDPAPLLQAAAAVGDGQPSTLQALAFMFQTLSAKLPAKDEATTLVAVLDHPQAMLRRYAIQRLGELREPATALALEGRLGRESRELLPLVQVSLQAVRGDRHDDKQPMSERLAALWTRARTGWDNLTPNHRYAALGGAAALVLLLTLVSVLRSRARARAQGHAWAAMAHAPGPLPDSGDEVDLSVGESGVYSPHDHDGDSLLQTQTGQVQRVGAVNTAAARRWRNAAAAVIAVVVGHALHAQAVLEVTLRADATLSGPPALAWARQQLPRFVATQGLDVGAALRVRIAADGVQVELSEVALPPNTYASGRIVTATGAQITLHCDDTGFETWRGQRAALLACAEIQTLLASADAQRGVSTAWLDVAALVGYCTTGIETESPTGLLLSLGAAECGELHLRTSVRGDDMLIEGRSRGGLAWPALLLTLAHRTPAGKRNDEQRWIALAFAARDSRREEAAMQLARFDSAVSARCLRALLHADDGARLRAIESLARRGLSDAVPAIVAAARGDPESTAVAAAALAALWPTCSPAQRDVARARAADNAALHSAIARSEQAAALAGVGVSVRALPPSVPAPSDGKRTWLACLLALSAMGVMIRVLGGQRTS